MREDLTLFDWLFLLLAAAVFVGSILLAAKTYDDHKEGDTCACTCRH